MPPITTPTAPAAVDDAVTGVSWWRWPRLGKRVFDMVFSTLALLLLVPVFLMIILAVRISSPGPAIYRQQRIGRSGNQIRVYKFRTMVTDAEERLRDLMRNDPAARAEYSANHKLRHDPRVTRIGGFLRRTSLDELPQFLNVWRGQMSIVGPRPMLPDERDRYGDALEPILRVRPGLTGLWQVSGRSDLAYPERVRLQADCALHSSLRTDLVIVGKTVSVMLAGESAGAY